jgi:shikimate kinase
MRNTHSHQWIKTAQPVHSAAGIVASAGHTRNLPHRRRRFGCTSLCGLTSPHTNLVLIGFMGSGKSALGRLAARELGFQFIDTDTLIVERAGLDIPAIFAQHGEEHFRELETCVLQSLTHLNRCVVSTGGGAVLRERNRDLMREIGFVVLLTASEEVLFERVSRTRKRPLLHTENPRETVARMLAERRPIYEAAAQCVIDTSTLTRTDAANTLLARTRAAFGWEEHSSHHAKQLGRQ